MKPTLIVMAAGMGSRFGGLKQVTPVGPNGETLIEYSVYDAVSAGFGKVVFVIKKAIEQEFRQAISDRVAQHVPVELVYQEIDCLPQGFTVPDGREKPWGTGHAVWCCAGVVNEPFAVINADDYYGQESYRLLANFLARPQAEGCRHLAMAGYVLGNTLTDHGYVSRGVCSVDANGMLTGLQEHTHIERREQGAAFTEDQGASWTPLPETSLVSMNCWAFPQGTLAEFETLLVDFLRTTPPERLTKAEFYLPFAVNSLIDAGRADVQVLRTDDRWYGMTYAADKEEVRLALARMTEEGKYPAPLWS